ncbi:MAG: uracil-DNA glycosylase family protein [Nannocystaceae bacterium]|nr:uracil-DNA glycosylase family protein [Nannocystaceae bacterium]
MARPNSSLPLLKEIRACQVCAPHLKDGVRPVVAFAPGAAIVIVGQAPGAAVHASGVPWDDPSGASLREWMRVDDAVFYDPTKIAIVPMGFCFPGHGRSGDKPPRSECAPLWHAKIFDQLRPRLTLLVGSYAQAHYLGAKRRPTLTETVRHWREHPTDRIALPHPSPRNRPWLAKNPWFAQQILPLLRRRVARALK